MQVHIVRPASVERSQSVDDSYYRVTPANQVCCIQLDRNDAVDCVHVTALDTAKRWDLTEMHAANTHDEFVELLKHHATIETVDVHGASSVADLDTHDGGPVVWVTATDLVQGRHVGTVLGVYGNPVDAAEKVRSDCIDNPYRWHEDVRVLRFPVKEIA